MRSRPLSALCCLTQASLFNLCLDDEDLRRLGAWSAEENRQGFSPALWSRARLHRRCREDETWARRVGDHLDLVYLDTVLALRDLPPLRLAALVDEWVAAPVPEALPGLLWGLVTDPRPAVHALGVRLSHEAVTAACQGWVRAGASDGSRAGR